MLKHRPQSVRLDFNPSILGPWSDFAAFLLVPIGVTAALALAVWISGLSMAAMSPVAFFLLFVGFDHLHVYLGIGTALNFPKHTAQRRLFYVGFPVACFAAYSLMYWVDPLIFYRVFAYASIFHFGRQQIGWMRAGGRRGCAFSKYDSLINDLVIYLSTFGFVVYRIAVAPDAMWFVENDLGYLPGLSAQSVLALIALVNLIYLGLQVQDWRRHRYVNVTKNLVWLSTLMAWGTAFGILRTYNIFAVALIVVHHAAPFIVLTALYVRKRMQEGFETRLSGPFVRLGGVLFAIAFAAATVEFALGEGWIGIPALQNFVLLAPFLATFSTYHYAIDSFFWREQYNPGCLRFNERPLAEPIEPEISLRKIS